MDINEIIIHQEGRRLEFKETLPTRSDLSKTVVAFANDAGGDIFIGIKDNPREIIGVLEIELVAMEEQISNIIYSRCYPGILPEISFVNVNDKNLIKITIYRGSTPPYYIKEKGSIQGTYIRVGSLNKLADSIKNLEQLICLKFTELEKQINELKLDNKQIILMML